MMPRLNRNIAMLVMAMVVGGILLGATLTLNKRNSAQSVQAASGDMEGRTTTIRPGDSLWAIARREYPGEHTGERVFEIRQLNPGLDPGKLQVGQVVKLP